MRWWNRSSVRLHSRIILPNLTLYAPNCVDSSPPTWQYLYMVRNVLIALCWFPLTIGLLVVNLFLLVSLTQKAHLASLETSPLVKINTSSYGTEQVLGASVTAGDARSLLLSKFLRDNQSPLLDYADYILDRADHYVIDFRLVPAIAMCESNVGKHIPSHDSFNAWGINVATGTMNGAKFPNWLYAIDWVSRYIKEKYYDRGLTSLVDIGAIWAPPSVENGNSWANCVSYFMSQIK